MGEAGAGSEGLPAGARHGHVAGCQRGSGLLLPLGSQKRVRPESRVLPAEGGSSSLIPSPWGPSGPALPRLLPWKG